MTRAIIVLTLSSLFCVFLIAGFLFLLNQELQIVTDAKEYAAGDRLKIKISNYSLRSFCFSSCHPYSLQKKEGSRNSSNYWNSYNYQSCSKPDLIESCIGPFETKAFGTALPKVGQGVHRLSIPVCQDCRIGGNFEEDNRLYSNEFKIR